MISDDEEAADHRVLLHAVDRALDEERRCRRGPCSLHAGHLAVDALDFGAHAVGDCDGVRARLLGAPACGCPGWPLMRMN